jgi:hypothetical protein
VDTRARICKRLRRPGIDSEDSIPPAYGALRAGMTNRVVAVGVPARQAGNRFLGSLKGLQIRVLVAMGHKISNVPMILKIWEIIFCFWANYFMGHFSGYCEGASTSCFDP